MYVVWFRPDCKRVKRIFHILFAAFISALTLCVGAEAAPNQREIYLELQRQLAPLLRQQQWSEAIRIGEKYSKRLGKYPDYELLMNTLIREEDDILHVYPFPNTVNTAGDEYGPVLSGNGKTLMFCGRDRRDNLRDEDIFVSYLKDGQWTPARLVRELSTTDNDAPVSLSMDGTQLFMFRRGQLGVAAKTAKGWIGPQPLPEAMHISAWQADAMLTADGKALLFVAAAPTDDSPIPSPNIFVSLMDEQGNWGTPISLGATINTPYIDRSPFLHSDMRTLYFASEGHGSMGGLDIYRTTRLNPDSWTEWDEPINMGKLINTPGNDGWFKISTDGSIAYFSQSTPSRMQDLYWMPLPQHLRPEPVAILSGRITNAEGQSIAAQIRWEDIQSGESIGITYTDPISGEYFIALPLGKNYGYYIDETGYFPLSNHINLLDSVNAVTLQRDMVLTAMNEAEPIRLNNIFFASGEATLLPESEPELQRIRNLLLPADNLSSVEIAGHTDNVGSAEDNRELSERRAEAVRNWLVAHGCNPDKLVVRGYGETMPVADNSTDEGRAQNRRVELRFLQ